MRIRHEAGEPPAPRLAFVVTAHATAAGFLPGIAGHFAAAGWDVTVICSPPDDPGPVMASGGVRVVFVPMQRDPSVSADLRSAVGLWRAIREVDPDVVLTATPKASLLATSVARLRRVPVVVHLMWGLRSETLGGPRRVLVFALESVATRLSHTVVPNSRSLADELVRRRMARPGAVTVLGAGSSHGVDTERFSPRPEIPTPRMTSLSEQLSALGPGPTIGFVGRITPDKGLPILLDALRLLTERGRHCRLMIVGYCEDDALAARVAEERAAGMPVLLLGPTDDTLSCYHVMDLHCLPTLREGFPNVCLEAAACAVPTVTTDATGAIDAVLDGVTGLVARKNDAGSLADRLAELLDDGPRRTRMGAAGRDWVRREFRSELVWRRHERLVRDLHEAGAAVGSAGHVAAGPPQT